MRSVRRDKGRSTRFSSAFFSSRVQLLAFHEHAVEEFHSRPLPPPIGCSRAVGRLPQPSPPLSCPVPTPPAPRETAALVLERCEGNVLELLERSAGPLPEATARALAHSLLGALATLHRERTFHCDLKVL